MIVNRCARAATRAAVLALVAPVLMLLTAGPSAAEEPPEPRVVVESARLLGTSSLGTWFGAAPRPTLEIVLYNNGQAPFTPALELEWRDGRGPAHAVDVPPVEEIAPGTRLTVEVPVQLDGFSQGEHTVLGAVQAGGREDVVEATTRVVPWGLYGLLVVVLLAASALRTRWVMSQMAREGTDEPRAEAPEPTEAPEAQALATMERFVGAREQQKAAVRARDEAGADQAGVAVPQQRAPHGGRRAARAQKSSGPWLTRR